MRFSYCSVIKRLTKNGPKFNLNPKREENQKYEQMIKENKCLQKLAPGSW